MRIRTDRRFLQTSRVLNTQMMYTSPGTRTMIRLLIVDDHDVVRMGLKQVFSGRVDMEVAGEARTGEEAIAQVRANPFDVALVDLSLADMSGVDVLNRSKAIRPEMAVLIVSGYPE